MSSKYCVIAGVSEAAAAAAAADGEVEKVLDRASRGEDCGQINRTRGVVAET